MDRSFAIAHKTARRTARRRSSPIARPVPRPQVADAGRTFGGPRIQAKLRIGVPGDRYEQQADRVADQVMRMPDPLVQRMCTDCEEEQLQRQPMEEEEEMLQAKRRLSSVAPPSIQRMCNGCEEEAQAKEMAGAVPQVDSVAEADIRALSGGRSLSAGERGFFEPRMGTEFEDVRVHTGPQAESLASAVQARAFTHGRDVVFGRGEYAPDSSSGRELMAHELAHVMQQRRPPS